MRFMILMYPDAAAECGGTPSAEDVAKMMKFNEELAQAGVLIALDGLHPSAKGARVTFSGGVPQVTDGPFTEAKEVLGGYWMIRAKSKDAALEWVKRCPAHKANFIELRQVFEMTDFPADLQKIAEQSKVCEVLGKSHA